MEMADDGNVPMCSLIDFYQHIPDYEDVMHLTSRELDERLGILRSMHKSYTSEWRDSPMYIEDFRLDHGCPKSYNGPLVDCYYHPSSSNPPCGASRYERSKLSTFDDMDSLLRLAKGSASASAVTTPSTLSNKSSVSKSAWSFGEEPVSKSTGHRKRGKRNGRKPNNRLYPGRPANLEDDFEYQQRYPRHDLCGVSWTDQSSSELGPNANFGARSLPSSPLNRRSFPDGYLSSRRKRNQLRSCQSTPDIRVTAEKNDHIFRAQPFPQHIFSNYLCNRREEKLSQRATYRKKRAEELLRSSSLPPSMRRRQKDQPTSPLPATINVKGTKKRDCSQERQSITASPYRFRYLGVAPHKKAERSAPSNRKSRKSSMEARDNLASLLRLQASRRKLEAESAMAAEAAASMSVKRLRARATRLSPLWHSALSRPTTAEELMLKAARKRDEAAERNLRRRRAVIAMRERVRAAPSLMERQTIMAIRQNPSLAGYLSSGSRSPKSGERTRRPPTATDWRFLGDSPRQQYASAPQQNGYARSHTCLSSYVRAPKKNRSRFVKSRKKCHSDDEIQKQSAFDSNTYRKKQFSSDKSLREVYHDQSANDDGDAINYDKRPSRPTSPYKARSPAHRSPNYNGSPEIYHTEEFTEEDNFLTDSHGEGSHTPLEPSGPNSSSCSRTGQVYEPTGHSHKAMATNCFKHEPHHESVYGSSRQSGFYSKQPFIKSETWPHSSPPKEVECRSRAFSLDQQEKEGVDTVTKKFDGVSLASSKLLISNDPDPFGTPQSTLPYPRCSRIPPISNENKTSPTLDRMERFDNPQTLDYARRPHTPIQPPTPTPFGGQRFSPTRPSTATNAERYDSPEPCLIYARSPHCSMGTSERPISPPRVPLTETNSRQIESQRPLNPLSPTASNQRRLSLSSPWNPLSGMNTERDTGQSPNHARSSQSSPQMRRRTIYSEYGDTHDFIAGLDLASRGELAPFHQDNLRRNVRRPTSHFLFHRRSLNGR